MVTPEIPKPSELVAIPAIIGEVEIVVPESTSVTNTVVELTPVAERLIVALPLTVSESEKADICKGCGRFQLLESKVIDKGLVIIKSASPPATREMLTDKGEEGFTASRTPNDLEFPSWIANEEREGTILCTTAARKLAT